jgi:hypothetical protein
VGFPKCDGCCTITAAELNYMFDPYDIKASMLENSVNVTKLNYKYNLQEITHDFMVVDVFTDANGYNNTVCVGGVTTSTYVSTALNGLYANQNIPVLCGFQTCASTCNQPVYGCVGNYCTWALVYRGTGFGYDMYRSACICNVSALNNNHFCFKICYSISINLNLGSYQSCAEAYTTNWQDNKNICCVTGSGTWNCIYCYAYCALGSNCYCFYCNGTGVCQVCLTTFPNIVLCAHAWLSNCCNSSPCSGLCVYDFCISKLSKITTVPFTWSSPIKSIYYTDEKIGSGSRVYNVIDASTGDYILLNALPKCTYSLCCSVCCHIYEIIQCNDAVSCIKSYAILAGHM